jgi:hypothetical protein
VHDGLVLHAGSLQSFKPLQFSSTLPVQSSVAFGRIAGFASLQSPSDGQKPSPSASVQGGQSRRHESVSSLPLQTPSPQQELIDCVVHAVPHWLASQPTGFDPEKPQQKRVFGLPPWRPLQSAGQLTQLSPLPASQMPLPQTAPVT